MAKTEVGNSTRVLRSQIFGAQNLDESHHWAFVSKDAEECFQGGRSTSLQIDM